MRSLNSCPTNGFWWLYPPASSSTSWASRVSPGYVWLVFYQLLPWCEPLHSLWCVVVCVNRQEYTGWRSWTSLSPAGCCCFWRSLRSSVSATFTVRMTFWRRLHPELSGDGLSSCLRRRKPFYWRHRNDARKKELRVLAVVESLLVLHQSGHHSGGCNANHRCHVLRRIGFYYVCELLNIHCFILGEKKCRV